MYSAASKFVGYSKINGAAKKDNRRYDVIVTLQRYNKTILCELVLYLASIKKFPGRFLVSYKSC